MERSRQWAIRCLHEASLYEQNAFITLTYNNDHLPSDGSVKVEHFQKFMKRLRKKFTGRTIRFFHCGEYGELNKRPHYHACLFNLDFNDRELWKIRDGIRLYTSATLAKLWPFGFSTVGDVTFDSAAYVARYIMKKITGDRAEKHYKKIDEDTGEIHIIKPEYTTMSRRPGLGTEWYQAFKSGVYPADSIVINGTEMRPPKFYDDIYDVEDPEGMKKIKSDRLDQAFKNRKDNTNERLIVKEKVKRSQTKFLRRDEV